MSCFGIDVSEHNGVLNWETLRSAGVQYAIIRTGYGKGYTDTQFHSNIRGALAQGIPVGVYHFSYALDAAGAQNEAKFVLPLLEPYKDKITLPVFFDFEYDTVDYAKKQGVTLGKQAFNDHAAAFCEVIKAAGYMAGVYYNLDYYTRFVDKSRLGGYVQWYAQYAAGADVSDWDIWQYSSRVKLEGHACNFDGNTMKNTALLNGSGTAVPGWKENTTGWWYIRRDGSYPKSAWEQVNGKWYYFDKEGYRMENKWIMDGSGLYFVGADGAMVKSRSVRIGADGRAVPAGAYYERLGEVPQMYRGVLDRLIEAGKLKGRGGSGDNLVLDMSEEMVRALVICSR